MTPLPDESMPSPPDEVTLPFWEATARNELTLQRCQACGHYQHYPRALCVACGGIDLEQVVAAGRGRVYSHSTVHRSPLPHLDAPYVVALVDLEEGPRLLTRIAGTTDGIGCGSAVHVVFEPLPDGRRLPLFELMEAEMSLTRTVPTPTAGGG